MNAINVWQRLLVALTILAVGVVGAYATTPGGSPENAIRVPSDNAKPSKTSSENENDETVVYVHNNSGADDNKTGTSATKVEVTAKGADDKGRGEGDKRDGRVVVKKVQKYNKDTEGWDDVTQSKNPADGAGKKVAVTLTGTAKHCDKLRITMVVQVRKKKKVSTSKGSKWVWDEWGYEAGTNVEFNIRLTDGFGDSVSHGGAGNDPFGTGDGGADFGVSAEDAFADLEPVVNFSATYIDEGNSGEFAAPDLVFSERGGWQIPTGTLQFFAVGNASFSSNSELDVLARDENGEDAVMNGDIAFGMASVIDGVIHVPVTYRSAESETKLAVMVRGALVEVPVLATGTIIGYAVGGASSGSDSVRIPPLLRTGAEPDLSVTHGSAEVEFLYDDAEFPGPTTATVGGEIHVARPYTGIHEGYLDAIVLSESEAGALRQGSFVVQPVDSFSFVATTNTKLYVINADNHAEVEDAFESAAIEVTASGALRVTLGARLVFDTALKLVILNPRVNMGQAPYAWGYNARAAIGGDALRKPLTRTVVLVEGGPGVGVGYHRNLPSIPLSPTQLTAIAAIEPE